MVTSSYTLQLLKFVTFVTTMIKPALTKIGAQMSNLTGVRAIMKDINETLRANQGQVLYNLSAGNPLILPEVEQLWRECTADLLASSEYGEVVCRYGSSQGYAPFIAAIVKDFNQRYGLQLTERNILVTAGSQTIYFYAANAYGGYTEDCKLKKNCFAPQSRLHRIWWCQHLSRIFNCL